MDGRFLRTAATLLLGTALMAASAASVAFDIRENGEFQLDGNTNPALYSGGDGASDDTDMIYADSLVNYSPMSTGAFREFFGDDSPQPDYSHHSKSNKDTLPLSQWTCIEKPNVTDKADLQQVFMAVYAIDHDSNAGTPEHTVLFGGGVRDSNNGDTNIGMWLFKTNVLCEVPPGANEGHFVENGGTLAQHRDGDILLVSEFSSGGKVGTIKAYEWKDPTDADHGGSDSDGDEYIIELVVNDMPFGDCADTYVGGDPSQPLLSPVMCGMVNTAENSPPDGVITPAWAPDTKSSPAAGQLAYGQYFEGGVDLTELLGVGQDVCISSFILETRSSTSLESALHDFVLGNLDTCGAIRVKKVTIGGDGTFAYDTDIDDGDLDGTMDFQLTTSGGASGWLTYDSITAGNYTINELAPNGFELTGVECFHGEETTPFASSVGPGISFEFGVQDEVSCIFTNVQPKLAVTKSVTSCLVDPGQFELRIDGILKALGGDGTSTGALFVSLGTHAVSETAGTGTLLADYVSSIGGDCDSGGSVTLSSGTDSKSCTISNVRRPWITVYKQTVDTVSGAAAAGQFVVTIDGTTYAAIGNGGSVGQRVDTAYNGSTFAGPAVSEAAGAGSDLADYTTIISCDTGDTAVFDADAGASRGLSLSALQPGDDVTCRIVNVLKATAPACVNE